MTDALFGDELDLSLDPAVLEVLREMINPTTAQRDLSRAPIPRAVFRQLGREGFLGSSLPTELGGGGMSVHDWGRVLQALGYLSDDGSVPLLVSLFAGTADAIARSGQSHLIDRYVRPLVRGEILCSFAWTEAADAFSFASTVSRVEGQLVVNGSKSMVTGGELADAFIVYLRDDETDDLDVVIVERDDPGVTVEPLEVMGVRTAGLVRLDMKDVRIPPTRLLKDGDGLSHVQTFLNQRRVLLCCGPLGRMRALLREVAAHLVSTERYGRRLADMHNVQATVGRMRVLLESSNATMAAALDALDSPDLNRLWSPEVGVAKYSVTENALQMAQLALRIVGGAGYTHQGRFERDVRDFMGLLAGAGAQDILEVDIGMNTIASYEQETMKR